MSFKTTAATQQEPPSDWQLSSQSRDSPKARRVCEFAAAKEFELAKRAGVLAPSALAGDVCAGYALALAPCGVDSNPDETLDVLHTGLVNPDSVRSRLSSFVSREDDDASIADILFKGDDFFQEADLVSATLSLGA